MRRRSAHAWLLAACFLASLAADPPRGAAEPPPAAPTAQALDAAIERAVGWLLREQKADGEFGGGDEALGPTALAAYALQHAGLREEGASKSDLRLARTLARIDALGPGRPGHVDRDPGTYTTSLLVMVLRARGRDEDRPRLGRLRDLLLRTQAQNGQWGYSGKPGDTGRLGPEVGDHSNTQFAMLALGALAAEGIVVPPEPLERTRRWLLSCQGPDKGYGYASGGATSSAPSASMTSAVLCCLAVLRALGDARDPEVDAAIDGAFGWLGDDFSVTRNKGPAQGGAGERQRNAGRGWLHYYLWTLERACVLAGRETIAGRDWYAEGAAHLLATQAKDGAWVGEAPLYATCFALLFLTRAADPPRVFTNRPRPDVTPRGGPAPPPDGLPPGPLLPADPRAAPPLAPDVLRERALAEGPASLKRLVLALEDPDAAVRRRAHEALVALLPAPLLEGVAERALPRNRLLLWIHRHRHVLVAKDGRFVVP